VVTRKEGRRTNDNAEALRTQRFAEKEKQERSFNTEGSEVGHRGHREE
jgi:hypothetical protein